MEDIAYETLIMQIGQAIEHLETAQKLLERNIAKKHATQELGSEDEGKKGQARAEKEGDELPES